MTGVQTCALPIFVEVLVHARESHVGDLVGCAQFIEHAVADVGRGDITTDESQLVLDALDHRHDVDVLDRATLDGGLDAGGDLGPVERLTGPVALDHEQWLVLEALVGGEAVSAVGAAAPAADGGAFLGFPRVDDLGVNA